MAQPADKVDLLVCIKCKQEAELPEGAERPGTVLYHRLAQAGVEGVSVIPVECLQNCTPGCTIALRGPGRWTYVYGRFDPRTDTDLVAEGATKYAATADGLIPWRERPQHFRKNCIARIPPLDAPVPNLGEM